MSEQIAITLPDGSVRYEPAGVTARAVAEALGSRLARAAVAARVNGAVWDLDRPMHGDTTLEIITQDDPAALEVLRHSAAHVLATAVRQLFPEANIGFGPAIQDGFYYDFEVPRPFTPEDLQAIERKMREVIEADHRFVREEVERDEAQQRFRDDPLKLERLEEFGEGEVISVYTSGPFVDLCRGPHLTSTGRLSHFKLLHAAGAYWRGDSRRQMLQRIYGTAWFNKSDLDTYLHQLEEAERRDHRVLGKQLDLFSVQEDVGPGMILWHPRGAIVQYELRRFIEDELLRREYELVYTPHVTREDLFIRSGHLPLYEDQQFPAMGAAGGEAETVRYRVKPMNCPMHAVIYASRQRSYRDLPVRLAEVANVYRNELSGTLHGLLRVRMLTMDDAHIFCREDQIEEEIFDMLDLTELVLRTFGFEYRIDLATRPVKKIGGDAAWEVAERALQAALDRRKVTYGIDEGGGAFYGPKIDIKLRDAIGREWQGTTIQLDYQMPQRLGLEYAGSDNKPHQPVMIHRAIYGTLERFVGCLIEHFAGAFPVWLAPEQVRVVPITDGQAEAACTVHRRCRDAGIRSSVDDRNETLNYRVRDAELMKVPYMAVVGQREVEQGTIALRARGAKKKQEIVPVDEFVERAREIIRSRALTVWPER
ncbi:MAG: threonine--tRNA ligase [Gemmatimonadales bacterium]|nr:threonine--tRNA ligase [Gemmatimonadales bacterium]NIN10829.1 threonine--tRNA ligase [Gemmatimonadales bacterium]NIN49472.1 threonine--tRNA ligase [Gemmatimonadales bacterium]NIP06936.1 threonine--tRNA ligase [Gemmatimonadales bacterium]NIR01612.1 threonine--tRNA ligase [Gemmatimonadales bacterium]